MTDITAPLNAGMTRWKAAAIHLLISATIAGIVLLGMLTLWYPSSLFSAEGALDLLKILVPVDIVLGPLITLIIFKSGKRGLRADLGAIALAQTCALVYGSYVMMTTRPVFIVFAMDQFVTVRANDLAAADVAKAKLPAYRRISLVGPELVAVKLATDKGDLKEQLLASLRAGKGLHLFPENYIPYADYRKEALDRSRPVEGLRKHDANLADRVEAQVVALGLTASNLNYLPLFTKRGQGLALLDAKTGDLVKMLPSIQ